MGGTDPYSSDALDPDTFSTHGLDRSRPQVRLMSENPIGPLLGQVLSLDQSATVGGGALSTG